MAGGSNLPDRLTYIHPTVDQSYPEGAFPVAVFRPPVAMEYQAATFPPNWYPIPQRIYDYGRRQRDYIRSGPIHFHVNGRPGLNIGNALRKNFQGLEGRDDLVLQDAGRAISCRLLVRLL